MESDPVTAQPAPKMILFVCSGNLCRSFMAERVFRSLSRKTGLSGVRAASAGLLDLGGADADPQAAALLREKGMEAGRHRSRALTAGMVEGADWVLVMEEAQRDEVLRRHPGAEGKVRLLKSFSAQADGAGLDIRDPHGLTPYHYRTCFAEIYFSLEGLLRCI
ncbi:MAG: Low molecular weight protein-tyrosine-phosphatase YwlE [Syntrophaceae bacterium PtaB.Bin038]|nr:MAG: Low molecular weight protein-tyrosine-phosphatase YwlE [Syntrophaceae bacterium PtaB.Bin038]